MKKVVGNKGYRRSIIGDPCLSKWWPSDGWRNIIDHPCGINIAPGSWPVATAAYVSSSLVWVINDSIHGDASSLKTSNNPYPCLLQPLTNEFSCHLKLPPWEKKINHWKTVALPRSNLKDTFNEIQSTEVMAPLSLFVFSLPFHPNSVVSAGTLFRRLLICKGMQIFFPVVKSRRHCPPYITTQI